MSTEIIAVVLNWNEMHLTLRCIESLYLQKNIYCDILVVDNNSNIDPSNQIISKFLNIKVLRNDRNLGVAGGRNVGIHFAIKNNYKYVLLFDNDAYADETMVANLAIAAKLHSDVGIFGPKIFIDGKKNVIWRAGCTSWKWAHLHFGFELISLVCNMLNTDIPKIFDSKRGFEQFDHGQYNQEVNIAFQIGCAQFIKIEVFNDTGLLDEEFSPYGSEDIDFCARAVKAGWKIRYIPKAICWHRAESSFRDHYDRSFYSAKNVLLLARKNLSPIYFCMVFLPDFIIFTIPSFIINSAFKKEFKKLKGFLSALSWTFKDILNRGFLL